MRNIYALKNIILLYVLFAFSLKSFAFKVNENIHFSSLTQQDGLSHNKIECIFKDSDGFMWFGTRSGLCRFDGYDIKIFRSSDNPRSLSGDRILCISEDQEGYLWIGTFNNGLNKYDRRTESFTRYDRKSSIGDRINRIMASRDGSLWVCSNQGLSYYLKDSDSFKTYSNKPSLANSLNSDIVYDIIETRSGDIYVATDDNEIQRFSPETETFHSIRYKRNPDLNQNYRKRLVEDLDGKIWIAAHLHGLSYYDPSAGESGIYVEAPGQLSTNILNGDMALAPDGKLWISTDGNGIIIMDPRTREFSNIVIQEDAEGALTNDQIYTIYFDDQDIVWVGTYGGGINYFNPHQSKFDDYYHNPGDLKVIKNKSVNALFQDSKGELWIGTDGEGLFMITPAGLIHSYTDKPQQQFPLSSNAITSINEDSDGNVLIGTYAGGLISRDKRSGRMKIYNQRLSDTMQINSSNVWDIFRDSENRIWLGLLGSGVDLFDPENETFINYGPESGRIHKIDFPNVMDIIEDFDGDVWFATEGKGIFVLDKETSRIYRIPDESTRHITSDGIIICLMQDHWGYIWIGTEGNGLLRYNKRTSNIIRFTSDEGLPSNIVQSILEDQQGQIWIGTANGLSVFHPETKSFSSFVMEEGLSGLECNRNALIQLNDGRLVLGTNSGINIFHPAEIEFNQEIPKVVFSGLKVQNRILHPGDTINGRIILQRSIVYTDEITLTHREKSFSIGFAALNYTLPQKCQYKYFLEGSDEGWISTGSDIRVVNYSNLSPGKYILKVIASNNDGNWGENQVELAINILPPFYNTRWFQGILLLILMLTLYFYYRSRLNLHKANFRRIQIEQERKIIRLENEQLDSELQKLTFHVLNRNRFLIEQKNRLIGLATKAKENVRVGLEDIIDKLYDELNDDKDWKYIEPQLDKVYRNFVTHLKEKHPDLNLTEIKIASYVRMNLTTKEISEFMHKTPRAVENDRYRLRKKIGIETNDSLQKYLINL